jgi:iron(II)-dependent oxidoreductase
MSKLCVDGDDMSDDQRDAMCNLGESLGLTGAQAEDLIDEYLEDVATMPVKMTAPKIVTQVRTAPPIAAARPVAVAAAPKPVATPIKPSNSSGGVQSKQGFPVITPLMRAQERDKHPNYRNVLGAEMLLVTSGVFSMGSNAQDAQPNEKPVTPTLISRFFISRFPVTNAQYERFDPTHVTKRAPWADTNHPVVYVSALDAEMFCAWLSKLEKRRYRLPSEAEWEYAAKGLENRVYPWGEHLNAGSYANFADARSNFVWRDPRLDDGWAQSSPVGAFPKGASPFGVEDLAGNVFEWCLDGFGPYRGKEMINPRGPREGGKRNYRGGSWKSRAASLRASSRNFNQPDYSSNDVGFRIVCECD